MSRRATRQVGCGRSARSVNKIKETEKQQLKGARIFSEPSPCRDGR